MKIKLLLCTIICVFALTGCGDHNTLLSYTSKVNNISAFASVSDGNSLDRITPFSEEVCVIPKEEVGVNVTDNFPAAGLLMVDITDNKMYYADGIYDKLYPASLTKLATALVCFKYGNMEDDVTISYTASHINEPGAKLCFLQEGDVINFETLLNSFLVYSGNDAGIALAEHISGSEKDFAKLMNKELKALGAVNTHFVNSHGLPHDNHYTSVYDIYLILNELANYDKFLEISSQSEYIADFHDKAGNNVRKVYDNTNMFLTGHKKLPKGFNIVAGKTGTTNAAGNCLAIIASGPDSHNYIAICMKAYSYDSLYSQINDLLKLAK